MEEENIKIYHPLGRRTLIVFMVKECFSKIPLLVILFAGIFYLQYVPSQYFDLAIYIIWGFTFLTLLLFVWAFFFGWLRYVRYEIYVNDKDLKLQRGLISVEQLGVPYRHIKDLKIERDLLDQIFGVSNIILTVLGSEDNQFSENKTTMVLPSVSREIALEIQDIVLKKIQVEQINVVNNKKLVNS